MEMKRNLKAYSTCQATLENPHLFTVQLRSLDQDFSILVGHSWGKS